MISSIYARNISPYMCVSCIHAGLDLETQPVDMDNDDTLLRKLLDLKPDAAMAEFSGQNGFRSIVNQNECTLNFFFTYYSGSRKTIAGNH